MEVSTAVTVFPVVEVFTLTSGSASKVKGADAESSPSLASPEAVVS